MRFGSVAFFKVLIKTVLCIAFFVPLVLCVVFAVVLWNKSAALEKAEYENEKLAYKVELLSGGMSSVEDFYGIYSQSGLTDQQLMDYLSGKNGVSQPAAPEDESSQPDTSEPEESSQPDTSEPSQPDAPDTEDEPSQPEDTSEPESTPPDEGDTSQPEELPAAGQTEPYELMYPDLTVRVPASFVRESNTVYLTFDDGPSVNTYSVLHYMEKYDLKATFFVVPQRTAECYAIMKQIVDSGHAIGVHSTTHVYEDIYSSVEAYLADFYEAWNMIYEATGVKTEIFRFPGGSKNDFNGDTRDAIIEEMTRRGFRFYDWNVDSNDAGGATWSEMIESIPADIDGNYRSIVLMHDSAPRENTVYVLEDIIKLLIQKGYKFDRINNDTQPVQFIGPYA